MEKREFLKLIMKIKKKEELFLTKVDFFSLSTLIQGVGIGFFRENFNFSKEFHKWLETKFNEKYSLTWAHFIFHKISDENDSLAKINLYHFLEEFFKETVVAASSSAVR